MTDDEKSELFSISDSIMVVVPVVLDQLPWIAAEESAGSPAPELLLHLAGIKTTINRMVCWTWSKRQGGVPGVVGCRPAEQSPAMHGVFTRLGVLSAASTGSDDLDWCFALPGIIFEISEVSDCSVDPAGAGAGAVAATSVVHGTSTSGPAVAGASPVGTTRAAHMADISAVGAGVADVVGAAHTADIDAGAGAGDSVFAGVATGADAGAGGSAGTGAAHPLSSAADGSDTRHSKVSVVPVACLCGQCSVCAVFSFLLWSVTRD